MMKSNSRSEVIAEGYGSTTSTVPGHPPNPFSGSIDLEWHNSPEGRGVLAHLTDQSNGMRKNYGK